MINLKSFFFSSAFLIISSLFSQDIIDEIVSIDSISVNYKIIHKETVGEYFQLKRYVFADDTSVVAIEKNYSNGFQNGITRVFYPSGKIRVKALYGNGKYQGEWTSFDEKGIIEIKGVYNQGIKHGYWAYKKEGVFGRYVNGKKHRNWKKKDRNGVKHKAWYWKGDLKRGSDIFNEDYLEYVDTAYNYSENKSEINSAISLIDAEYVESIKYLASSYYFRKVCKEYFRKTKKERKIFVDDNVDYQKDVMNFNVQSELASIDINYFLEQKKLLKPGLDSLLKATGKETNEQLKSTTQQNINLEPLSTDKSANLQIKLAPKQNRLIVTEIFEKSNTEVRLKILILLDENNQVKEVEYQLREW